MFSIWAVASQSASLAAAALTLILAIYTGDGLRAGWHGFGFTARAQNGMAVV
jgi:hypothetical protein